ncbi:MAG: peptidoglycan bridge formation glycyltransferase FemA/FemB family protein [Candidatus Gribaldobacteria bacterium]|nr:peptidoglycan bridge formation glycyltransferase FemA/FemB family protein [Candidatus Gribaldobacteria bacterium]
MELIAKQIESKEVWERFMVQIKPNTFLHSWNWGEFQSSLGNATCRLAVFQGENLTALAFFYEITARRGIFWLCPHGPIFKSNADKQVALKILLDFLRKEIIKNQRCDFIRICPLLGADSDNEKIFSELGFKASPLYTHPELSWLLDVDLDKEKLLSAMRKGTRYSIKKATQDGVSVEQSSSRADLEKFRQIYQSTSQRQKFAPFSKNYLDKEWTAFQKDNQCLLFFGYYQGKIISAAFIVFSQRSAFYHHGASLPEFAKIPSAHLVLWEAILEAKNRGCKFFNFWGISPDNQPAHPWFGLSFFKKGFGGFSEQYVASQDLILSWRYWLNFVVEKWRKKKRGM